MTSIQEVSPWVSTIAGDFDFLVAAGYDWKYNGLTIGPIASFQLATLASMDLANRARLRR
jgi:hypothetical protein